MELAPGQPSPPQSPAKRKVLLVGVVFVLAFAGLIAGGWFAMMSSVPVRPSMADGMLVLTSRSDSLWIAHVHTDGSETKVDVPAGQAVQVAAAVSGRPIDIELFRPGSGKHGWVLAYTPPHLDVDSNGFDAGTGLTVSATLSELLKLNGK